MYPNNVQAYQKMLREYGEVIAKQAESRDHRKREIARQWEDIPEVFRIGLMSPDAAIAQIEK